MNCNLESEGQPSQLGLGTSGRSQLASYDSLWGKSKKDITSPPTRMIRARRYRDHTRGGCASDYKVTRRSKSSQAVSIPWCRPNPWREPGREASADLCYLLACAQSQPEPIKARPRKADAACSLHVIRIHFHMFLSSSLRDNCSSGAQGVGGQEVCTPVYQLTKCLL